MRPNRRLLIIFLFLALISLTINAKKSCNLKIDRKNINVGIVYDTDPVKTYIIKFKNKSKKRLKITDIRTSCGCLSAEYPRYMIDPGKGGEIKLVLDLTNFHPMEIEKKAGIYTNLDESPQVVMLTGEFRYAN